MSLTSKQERRVWYCLSKMKHETVTNPMDIKGRVDQAYRNQEAARSLVDAMEASIDRWGADEVNSYLREAESTLELGPMEPEGDEP